MCLLLSLEPFQKFAVGGGWSKDILEFRFGPNLGLRLKAETKLKKRKLNWIEITVFLINKYHFRDRSKIT